MSTSHFFAYLSRMKFIRRWGLMHSTYPENIQEHSLRAAQIAHALAIIRNRLFGGDVSPERAATLALYHDISEVHRARVLEIRARFGERRATPGDHRDAPPPIHGWHYILLPSDSLTP